MCASCLCLAFPLRAPASRLLHTPTRHPTSLHPPHLAPPSLQGPVLFRRAAFVPPGYASLLFAHLYEPASCPLPTSLFAGFRRFVLASFGLRAGGVPGTAQGAGAALAGADGVPGGGAERPLTVRLISRRPAPGKPHMARQIGNEEELLGALRALRSGSGSGSSAAGQLDVSLLDFAGLPCEGEGRGWAQLWGC